MGNKKLVYIAYPYRAKTRRGIRKNIKKACQYGKLAYAQGYIPLIPHINSSPLFGLMGGDDSKITEYDLYLLSACKCLWLCGSTISKGMETERDFATRAGIPIKYVGMPIPHTKVLPSSTLR